MSVKGVLQRFSVVGLEARRGFVVCRSAAVQGLYRDASILLCRPLE